MNEDRVRRILRNKKLPKMRSKLLEIARFIEKSRSVDCLFLPYLKKGDWKQAKKFLENINRPISDGTFRARITELERLKIVSRDDIDPLKRRYRLTQLGRVTSEILLELFEKLEKHI